MPIERFMTHRVAIVRRTFDDTPDAQDDYGQPGVDSDTLASDVPAAIIPKSAGEVAAPHQAGLAYGTHLVYLFPQDLRTSDFIRHTADDCPMSLGGGVDLPDLVLEVVAVPLGAGIGHHLEVDARVQQNPGRAMHVAQS